MRSSAKRAIGWISGVWGESSTASGCSSTCDWDKKKVALTQVDLATLRREEREAFREREKVEEMLFHEIVFDLMAALENEQVLGTDRLQHVTKASAKRVLGVCIRDSTDYSGNLEAFTRLFKLTRDDSEFQRIEFVCKYILKKSLRKKADQARQKLRPATASRGPRGLIPRDH